MTKSRRSHLCSIYIFLKKYFWCMTKSHGSYLCYISIWLINILLMHPCCGRNGWHIAFDTPRALPSCSLRGQCQWHFFIWLSMVYFSLSLINCSPLPCPGYSMWNPWKGGWTAEIPGGFHGMVDGFHGMGDGFHTFGGWIPWFFHMDSIPFPYGIQLE